jgi:hypothetical protein
MELRRTERGNFGQDTAYAVLTTRASKVLSTYLSNHTVNRQEADVLVRAAALLGRIVEGSLLVENRTIAGFAASHVGLAEYQRALSAAETLNLLSHNRSVTDILVTYRTALLQVAEGKPGSEVEGAKQFFAALSSYFAAELLPHQGPARTLLELQ